MTIALTCITIGLAIMIAVSLADSALRWVDAVKKMGR